MWYHQMAALIPNERCVILASLIFSCKSKRNRLNPRPVLPPTRRWSLICQWPTKIQANLVFAKSVPAGSFESFLTRANIWGPLFSSSSSSFPARSSSRLPEPKMNEPSLPLPLRSTTKAGWSEWRSKDLWRPPRPGPTLQPSSTAFSSKSSPPFRRRFRFFKRLYQEMVNSWLTSGLTVRVPSSTKL